MVAAGLVVKAMHATPAAEHTILMAFVQEL